MDRPRYLIVTADDYGIGPATSKGILELGSQGLLTGTVLLVNSPHAELAVKRWHQSGRSLELGWHPCLTLDRPVLPPSQVPSLVDQAGFFYRLGPFLKRILAKRIHSSEIEAELTAQHQRFQDMVGAPPTTVNSHHHVQVFSPVREILLKVLGRQTHLPYMRRVCEPWRLLSRISGARLKRLVLSHFGAKDAILQRQMGFPGNDWLIGITNPPCVARPSFFARWIAKAPGNVVELTCHPGHWDTTLLDRDCQSGDGQLLRRVQEMQLLKDAHFKEAVSAAGFTMVSPSELLRQNTIGNVHAA